MLLAVSAASVSAQTYQIRKDSVKTGEYSPTVYLVSVNAPQPPADEEALLEAAVLNQLAIDNAIRDYIETHHPGFQQDELPHFIFATKQNKFSFSLGGQVTLRASYDFDGISGAQDFIPATIAVPGTYATRQKFGLDGTTSRIFLKAIANSKKLGRCPEMALLVPAPIHLHINREIRYALRNRSERIAVGAAYVR